MKIYIPFFGKVDFMKAIINYLYIFSWFGGTKAKPPSLTWAQFSLPEISSYNLGNEESCTQPFESTSLKPFLNCKQFDILTVNNNSAQEIPIAKCISETLNPKVSLSGESELKDIEQPFLNCLNCTTATLYLTLAGSLDRKNNHNKVRLSSGSISTTILGVSLSKEQMLIIDNSLKDCIRWSTYAHQPGDNIIGNILVNTEEQQILAEPRITASKIIRR